jgi:iron complex outermembrane receptor protein
MFNILGRPQGASALAAAASAIAIVASISPASAQAQQHTYNIPAQPLSSALLEFSRQSDTRVMADPATVNGRTAPALQGTYSVDAGLNLLLAGSGLTHSTTPSGAIMVTNPTQLGEQTPPSDTETIVVTGRPISHLSDTTRTGTRMDADPMTLPLSVSTVSGDLIKHQQAINLADVASNVVGVTPGPFNSYEMRGFAANIMRDGTLGATGQGNNMPIVAVERVEVVKGPEAIIAGLDAGYGGVINVITKTPPNIPTASLTSSAGTRGYYDLGLDIGGPLNDNATLLGRLVASTQNSRRDPAGYDGPSSDFLSPSFTVRIPNWGTELTAQYTYQNSRVPPGLTVVAAPTATSLTDNLPLVRFGPRDSRTEVLDRTATLSLDQRITDAWKFSIRYSHETEESNGVMVSPFPFFFFFPYPNIPSLIFDEHNQGRVDSVSYELRGTFDTGPIAHKLLLTYDDRRTQVIETSGLSQVWMTNVQTGATAESPFAEFLFGAPTPDFTGGDKPRETGELVMDQMTWGNLIALAGFRHIEYRLDALNTPPLPTYKQDLPSFGLVYRLTPDLSLYVNASKGYRANQGLYEFGGNPSPPENAQQYEAGLKYLMFGQRIATTLAWYKINQENVAVPDQAHPWPINICLGSSQVCYVSVPGVQSQGVELEVSGEVLPHLQVRASYNYLEKQVDPQFQADLFYARNQANLWATYNFGNSDNLGWWAGAGLQWRSARNEVPGDLNNPGQARIDVSAGYDAPHWSAVFGIKNVTDQELYDVNSGALGLGNVTQPREWYATVNYRF